MLTEFDIIRRFFSRSTRHTKLAGGDDAAILEVSPGCELVVSTDMLVSGRHFFADADAFKLGHKALAVNLSDMAAMGAQPRWATLSLALPAADETWIQAFADGFYALAAKHDVDLIGGDTTRGPLNICVQIMGETPRDRALRRAGARAGDRVWVSGTIGDAALALAHLRGELALTSDQARDCRTKLDTPIPQVALGVALRDVANSCIDISDGLVADLGHILERSKVGATIEFERVPRSAAIEAHLDQPAARAAILAGGDDYELCFTAPPALETAIETIAQQVGVSLTPIGRISERGALIVLGADGAPMPAERKGFDHFV